MATGVLLPPSIYLIAVEPPFLLSQGSVWIVGLVEPIPLAFFGRTVGVLTADLSGLAIAAVSWYTAERTFEQMGKR